MSWDRVCAATKIPTTNENMKRYPTGKSFIRLQIMDFYLMSIQLISQQHPTTFYRTAFLVCVVLVLSVIRCSCYFFLLFHHDFHHDTCDYHLDFYGHSLLFELHFRLPLPTEFWFYTTPWMIPHLDILVEYWIEHGTFELLYVMITYPIRITYRGVLGFATDCSCGD